MSRITGMVNDEIAAGGISRMFVDHDAMREETPVLRFFHTYWERVRGNRVMPSRADIRPGDIKSHIGSIVVAEALPGFEDFRFKLIGTDVARYFLADAAGRTVREFYVGEWENFGECVLQNYRETALKRRPLLSSISDIRWTNKLRYSMQALYLPLSEDGEVTSSVLTAFTYQFCSARHAPSRN